MVFIRKRMRKYDKRAWCFGALLHLSTNNERSYSTTLILTRTGTTTHVKTVKLQGVCTLLGGHSVLQWKPDLHLTTRHYKLVVWLMQSYSLFLIVSRVLHSFHILTNVILRVDF
jgi:hypothetical protein